MIRVVLDTNIIVSPLLNDEGNEAAVLLLALQRTLRLYISPSILTEYNDVLHCKKFSFDPARARRLLDLLLSAETVVEPTPKLTLSLNESDTRAVESAAKVHAD